MSSSRTQPINIPRRSVATTLAYRLSGSPQATPAPMRAAPAHAHEGARPLTPVPYAGWLSALLPNRQPPGTISSGLATLQLSPIAGTPASPLPAPPPSPSDDERQCRGPPQCTPLNRALARRTAGLQESW